MRMRICDRCGEQIHGSSGYFTISVFGAKDIEKEYRRSLRGKDFCRECIANIVEFALNKNVCDECIKEMEETTALMNAADDEEKGSGSQEEPDPDEIDWTEALERMEQPGLTGGSQC